MGNAYPYLNAFGRRTAFMLGILLACCGTIAAQDGAVSLPSGGMTIGEVIEQAEKQTGYLFAYETHAVEAGRRAGIPAGTHGLAQLLQRLTEPNGLTYMTTGKYIIISPDGKKAARQAAPPPAPVPADDGYSPSDPASLSTAPARREREKTEAPAAEAVRPAEEASPVAEPETYEFYSSYLPADTYSHIAAEVPSLAIKTNLLYGVGTLTPNLGLEIGLARQWSLDIMGSYNPWHRIGTPDNNDKFVHWIARGEARYWLCQRYDGHFFGGDLFFARFNIGGRSVPLIGFGEEYRYDGWAMGVGASYGFHLPLGVRWGLEFSAGVGLAWLSYGKFDRALCSGMIENPGRLYAGITKLSIGIVYIIK